MHEGHPSSHPREWKKSFGRRKYSHARGTWEKASQPAQRAEPRSVSFQFPAASSPMGFLRSPSDPPPTAGVVSPYASSTTFQFILSCWLARFTPNFLSSKEFLSLSLSLSFFLCLPLYVSLYLDTPSLSLPLFHTFVLRAKPSPHLQSPFRFRSSPVLINKVSVSPPFLPRLADAFADGGVVTRSFCVFRTYL